MNAKTPDLKDIFVESLKLTRSSPVWGPFPLHRQAARDLSLSWSANCIFSSLLVNFSTHFHGSCHCSSKGQALLPLWNNIYHLQYLSDNRSTKTSKKMLPICKVWVVPSGSHASAFVKCICLKMQGQSIVLSFIFIQFIPVATNKTDLENNQNNSKDKKIHLVLFWLSLIRLYEQWSRLMAHVWISLEVFSRTS